MDKQSVAFIIIALILGFVVGYLAAMPMTSSSEAEIKKALVGQLREDGFLPPEPEVINEVDGEVKKVEGRQITLAAEQRYADPLWEFVAQTLTVKVSEETIIFRWVEKPAVFLEKQQAEYREEMAQYEKGIMTDLPEAPGTMAKTGVELSEIQAGDKIIVEADSNIKGKTEFTAASIEVQQ